MRTGMKIRQLIGVFPNLIYKWGVNLSHNDVYTLQKYRNYVIHVIPNITYANFSKGNKTRELARPSSD